MSTEREQRLELALTLASQMGHAYRGDWADFDGRTLRDAMDDLASVAAGTTTVEQYRAMHDLCPHGEGHWTEYCGTYGCAERAEDGDQ